MNLKINKTHEFVVPEKINKEFYDSILIGYRGSIAHDTYIPDHIDDIDLMAIKIPAIEHYFGLKEYGSRGTKEIKDDKFNEKFYNTNTKSEALCLIVLIFNCINGIYRVGKNGFNQGFGNRNLTNRKLKKVEECIEYLKTISHKINLYNDYKHILCFRNALYFLDPPYYLTCNSNSSWNKKDTEHLFNNLNLDDNDVIYTDVENIYGDKFFTNKIILNKMKYIHPKREHNKHKLNEALYFNF